MAWYKDKILWTIIAVAGAIKCAMLLYLYFFGPLGEEVLVFPDSLTYVYPAQTLLTYGQLWEAVSVNPLLLRTPGYPVFLAFIQLISGNMTWAVAVVQNILSLALLLPVYLTARRLATVTAARWSAAFCAASVLYFSLSFAVLTEVACVFLLAWFIFLTVRWVQEFHARDLFGAALLLTAAVYVRPAAYYFVPVACLFFFALGVWKKSAVPVKQTLLYFLAPSVLLIGAWQVRNFYQTGYSGFTSVGAYNLYIWNEDFVAKEKQISVAQAHDILEKNLPDNFEKLSVKTQVQTYKKLAAPLLKQSWKYKLSRVPVWAGKVLLGTNHVHLSRLIFGQADEPEKALNQTSALPKAWLITGTEKILFLLAFLQVMSVVLLGIIGLVSLCKTQPITAIFFVVYMGYFWAISSTFLGAYARFRAPFEIVLCIGAGIAVATYLSPLKTNNR
ncbi:ArnT family glycosyltransferase [Candidatus Avelusimicrobium luingense]|uniref:ArnT family glycosyltransferase n=1 Tax=Candidatus Avelusimicrobium luingense TaxID=3416211 RepID=UPI003D1170D6